MSTDRDAIYLKKFSGEWCTPIGFTREAKKFQENGWAVFKEWPSGHWQVTDKGWNAYAATRREIYGEEVE